MSGFIDDIFLIFKQLCKPFRMNCLIIKLSVLKQNVQRTWSSHTAQTCLHFKYGSSPIELQECAVILAYVHQHCVLLIVNMKLEPLQELTKKFTIEVKVNNVCSFNEIMQASRTVLWKSVLLYLSKFFDPFVWQLQYMWIITDYMLQQRQPIV